MTDAAALHLVLLKGLRHREHVKSTTWTNHAVELRLAQASVEVGEDAPGGLHRQAAWLARRHRGREGSPSSAVPKPLHC